MKRTSRIFGRELDLDRLSQLIDEHLLVTVWGPAGIGKTRLVEELLSRRRGLFCDLSETRSEEEVTALVSRFASRDAGILVLDNFEQVIECAPAIRFAIGEPNRIVVTSRERLRLDGEACFELGPLRVEDAVELFIDRAGSKRRSGDDATLRALVDRLDCIPLALELAAARHDLLGIDGLAARLDEPIPLLSRHRRDAPDRHATLEAAIAWSWDALGEREQRALMQCSAFRGGFTLAAAEDVLDVAPVLDLLQSLRDQSLLRSEARGGERRFSMLESVRDFAARRLSASGDPRSLWARHAAYFGALSGSHEEERANLLIAVERSLDDPDGLSSDAVRALIALEPLFGARGPYDRYLALLDRALLLGPGEPKLLRARGKILQRLGRLDRAEADLVSALTAARALGDRLDEGAFLTDLGVLRHQERRLDEAEALYREALAIHQSEGASRRRAASAASEDGRAGFAGPGPEGASRRRAASGASEDGRAGFAGHRRAEGRVLGNIGAVEHDRKAYLRAEAAYQAALAIDREVGDRRHEGLFLGNLGILDHERGELARAALRYEDALRILEEVKDDRLLAITLGNRGALHQELGEVAEAAAAHRRALELLHEVGDQRSLGLGMIRLAAAEAVLGARGGEAGARLAAAEALLARPRDDLGLELAALAAAFIDLAAARRAWLQDAAEESSARIREARRRLEASRPLQSRSDDARLFARMLERTVESFGGPSTESVLAIAPGARWIFPPHHQWVDLSRRHPIRRMLIGLVEAALAGGRWLSLEELQGAAWPGEAIHSEAASNRVYVALSTLRKLGLAEVLVSGESGYRIEPSVPIAFCARS